MTLINKLFKSPRGSRNKRSRSLPLGGDRLPAAYLWLPEGGEVSRQARRRPRRRTWPWALAVLLLLASAVTAVVRADKPPIFQLETSRKAIAATRGVNAGEWAPGMVRAAEESLAAASREVDRQNLRFFVIRDYELARTRARHAEQLARETIVVAMATRDSVKKEAIAALAEAAEALKEARQAIQYIQLDGYTRGKLVRGDIARQEAMKAAGDGHYRLSLEKSEEAMAIAEAVKAAVDSRIGDYHKDVALWNAWARQTIEWSRVNRSHAILVRKMEHRCDVYFAGQLKTSFPAELGIRWMGHKKRAGDHVTPEGRYQIIKKKTASRYHRALEINYPNDEDRRRFNMAKKNGDIPRSAGIGGLIEIHGHGGRGRDWTQGCVALRNDHMDKIFSMADVGTPVTIVGSYGGDDLAKGIAR